MPLANLPAVSPLPQNWWRVTAMPAQKRKGWDKVRQFIIKHPDVLLALLPLSATIGGLLGDVSFIWMLSAAVLWVSHWWLYHPLMLLMGRHDIVLQLFNRNEETRHRAFEQLLQKGEQAIPIFVCIVKETPRGSLGWGRAYKAYIEAICLAAEGIGRLRANEGVEVLLEATQDSVPDIRAIALWALGQIGDERAVAAAIPLLTDKSPTCFRRWLYEWTRKVLSREVNDIGRVFYWTVRAVAAAVLRQLGLGDLVRAFWRALTYRDAEAVAKLKAFQRYRKEMAEALIRVLDTGTVSEAVNAAWLLGELWAFEALPALRAKMRSPFTAMQVREECQKVVAKLEALATLPSPAAEGIDPSVLPRPAVPTDIATDVLPRAAFPEGQTPSTEEPPNLRA